MIGHNKWIAYNKLVKIYTSFKAYFIFQIPSGSKVAVGKANCNKPAPWVNASVARMYKTQHKLLYPVNVGRNVARESAPTHYVLASDIELYPSPGLTTHFLEMIRRGDDKAFKSSNPRVFVLSIFEVTEKSQPPANKTMLVSLWIFIALFGLIIHMNDQKKTLLILISENSKRELVPFNNRTSFNNASLFNNPRHCPTSIIRRGNVYFMYKRVNVFICNKNKIMNFNKFTQLRRIALHTNLFADVDAEDGWSHTVSQKVVRGLSQRAP